MTPIAINNLRGIKILLQSCRNGGGVYYYPKQEEEQNQQFLSNLMLEDGFLEEQQLKEGIVLQSSK